MTKSEFIQLLTPHYNDAVNYCGALCMGSDKAEAEDVIQQALLKAYEKIDTLRDPARFRSWLFQIITRCFYDSVRAPFWKRFVSFDPAEADAKFVVYEEDTFSNNTQLLTALSQLSEKERSAILLFEIGGFSIKEIKEMQNESSESAIKSRLSRTRTKLKEIMVAMDEATPSSRIAESNPKLETSDLYHETSKVIHEIKSIG